MRNTNEQEELQWQEFMRHLEWPESFSLIILFVDDPSLADVFKTRLKCQLKAGVSALQTLEPETSDTLTNDFFSALDKQVIPGTKVPLWVTLNRRSEAWDKARDDFFSRLNEYRDQLRQQFPHPVILLVPLAYKSRLREIAPDLWSVRSYTDELLSPPSLAKKLLDTTSAENEHSMPSFLDFDKAVLDAIEIREWQRIQNQRVSDYELLRVGWRAFDVALKAGAWRLAEIINQIYLPVARNQVTASGETPETLRDLSISLEKVGDMENTLGRREAANENIKECLRYLKRLHAALPEDKEYPDWISTIEKKLALWRSSNL